MNTIPQLIKQARKASGLTQQEVATRIGADKGYISLIESGKKAVSIEKMTEILGVSGFEIEYSLRQKPE